MVQQIILLAVFHKQCLFHKGEKYLGRAEFGDCIPLCLLGLEIFLIGSSLMNHTSGQIIFRSSTCKLAFPYNTRGQERPVSLMGLMLLKMLELQQCKTDPPLIPLANEGMSQTSQ